MVMTDVDHELRQQLKEAGRLLSKQTMSLDELHHVLDQLEKLLSKVDQTPDNLMQEALKQPMKALVDESLLEHSCTDVKVSVASCLCEITRISAPDAPYNDEEMKRIFQCIVSSLEDLSDKSSRSYAKRVSILETVSKVRSCVIMLDLECDDLIVKLFEHFLNSVRDHHLGIIFSLMRNIMILVLEESEEISPDILKPLLASIKNNSEGVLPVARKLGEEVIKKSADKLRPYLNNALSVLGGSLVDYSQVLTSICEGTTDFVKHNDESASGQPKGVDSTLAIVSSHDAPQVIKNGEIAIRNEGDAKPQRAVDHTNSNLTNRLGTNDLVVANLGNAKSRSDTTKSAEPAVSETVHGENIAEKSPEDMVSVKKPLEGEVANAPSQSGSQQEKPHSKIQIKTGIRSKKKGSSQTDPPSIVVVLTKVNEGSSDPDMRSPKRVRKKTPKAEENKPSVTTDSDVDPLKNLGKKVETGGDSEPKLAKRSGKKVGGSGSTAKKRKLSGKEVSEAKKSKQDDKKVVEAGGSEVKAKPAKRSLKKDDEADSDAKPLKKSGKKGQKGKVISKPSEDIANKDEETDSDNIPLKPSENKENKDEGTDSDNTPLKPAKRSLKKDNETVSDAKPLKKSGKRGQKSKVISKRSEDIANKDEETDSDNIPLKLSENKKNKDDETDSDNTPLKPAKRSLNKDNEIVSDAKPLKKSGKKGQKSKVISKPNEDISSKDEETDSDNIPLKPAKRSLKKDNEIVLDAKPLKKSGKKGQKSKVISKPSEDISSQDEETDSDNIPLKRSEHKENKDEETDADNTPLKPSENNEVPIPVNLSEDKDEEETDSDNIPLKLSAKRGNKSSSSVVKSSSKNKDGKKQGCAKNIEEKDQAKSLSEDDGMNVPLKSVLKKATKGKGNLKEALSTGSKRKRSITKSKVTEAIKYDDSLVGQKVKVWWPDDKMYYEGVVESFDPTVKKHTILYVDGDQETLNLRKEKWEILKEFSTLKKEVALEAQNTDIDPETAASSKDESEVTSKEAEEVKSKDEEEMKKDDKNEKAKKIVYSRGKKGSKSKTKSSEDNVKESVNVDAAEEQESEKEKSTETPKIRSKSGTKKRKIN